MREAVHFPLASAAVAVGAAVLAMNCSTHEPAHIYMGVRSPTYAPDSRHPCDIPIAAGVVLTPREECWLKLIRDRCGPRDSCLADCFANAKDRERTGDQLSEPILGGCWHVCLSFSSTEWKEPEGWKQCQSLEGSRPKSPGSQ
jgi:hypothetical protein